MKANEELKTHTAKLQFTNANARRERSWTGKKPGLLFLSAVLATNFWGIAGPVWAADPPALTYTDQLTSNAVTPTFIHSGICTSAGGVVWDYLFADMVKKNVGNNYNEIAFAFNECFGGGMIDELRDLGLVNTSFTSAARHDQPSVAGLDPATKKKGGESFYNFHYAPKAGGAAPQKQKDAATFARANDFVGPFFANWKKLPPPLGKEPEDPQYLGTDNVGESIQLHKNSGANAHNNTKYRAILFGGSTANFNDLAGNGFSIIRIHDELVAAGYANNEVLSLFTGGANLFNLANIGPWVNRDTKFNDLAGAWKLLKANTDADTQIFYWNSWGHGTSWLDAAAKRKFEKAQPAKKGLDFEMNLGDAAALTFLGNLKDIYNFWVNNGNDPATLPYFEVVSDLNLPNLTIMLNHRPLTPAGSNVMDVLDDGTEIKYEYRFALTQSDVFLLSATNVININYDSGGSTNDDLSFLGAGPALGDFANGPSLVLRALLDAAPGPNGLFLSWPVGWTLQGAHSVQGTWADILGPTNSYTAPFDSPQNFFRLRQSADSQRPEPH